jgi:hypothetical protein
MNLEEFDVSSTPKKKPGADASILIAPLKSGFPQ